MLNGFLLQEVQIGGWTLVRKVGTNETVFKFHRTLKVDGGSFVTVWSSDLGQTHEPPSTIVMKGQKWFAGDNMTTQLVNGEGEVRNSRRNVVCFWTVVLIVLLSVPILGSSSVGTCQAYCFHRRFTPSGVPRFLQRRRAVSPTGKCFTIHDSMGVENMNFISESVNLSQISI